MKYMKNLFSFALLLSISIEFIKGDCSIFIGNSVQNKPIFQDDLNITKEDKNGFIEISDHETLTAYCETKFKPITVKADSELDQPISFDIQNKRNINLLCFFGELYLDNEASLTYKISDSTLTCASQKSQILVSEEKDEDNSSRFDQDSNLENNDSEEEEKIELKLLTSIATEGPIIRNIPNNDIGEESENFNQEKFLYQVDNGSKDIEIEFNQLPSTTTENQIIEQSENHIEKETFVDNDLTSLSQDDSSSEEDIHEIPPTTPSIIEKSITRNSEIYDSEEESFENHSITPTTTEKSMTQSSENDEIEDMISSLNQNSEKSNEEEDSLEKFIKSLYSLDKYDTGEDKNQATCTQKGDEEDKVLNEFLDELFKGLQDSDEDKNQATSTEKNDEEEKEWNAFLHELFKGVQDSKEDKIPTQSFENENSLTADTENSDEIQKELSAILDKILFGSFSQNRNLENNDSEEENIIQNSENNVKEFEMSLPLGKMSIINFENNSSEEEKIQPRLTNDNSMTQDLENKDKEEKELSSLLNEILFGSSVKNLNFENNDFEADTMAQQTENSDEEIFSPLDKLLISMLIQNPDLMNNLSEEEKAEPTASAESDSEKVFGDNQWSLLFGSPDYSEPQDSVNNDNWTGWSLYNSNDYGFDI